MNESTKAVKTIRSIKEFIDWLEEVKGSLVLYRGLADAAWEVESSAYRRIKPPTANVRVPPLGIIVVEDYIAWLLERASLQGFRKRGSGELSDLELLAELQHNGAATCLIDFTSNPLVALWFACQEESGKVGKVVAMRTDSPSDFSTIDSNTLKKRIEEFLNISKLWKWTPSNLNNRIVAQGSVFVFGEGKIEKERWHYEEIKVVADNKQVIREELKQKFGISEESLFSDFTGFALSNAHDKTFADHSAHAYFSVALVFQQIDEFEKAKNNYDKAIELDPRHIAAYSNRALVKRKLGDHKGAITDFDKALEFDPKHEQTYRQRGLAKRASRDISGAIDDFDKAIDINPRYAQAYVSRGIAKRRMGEFQDAVTDLDKALELAPEHARAYRHRGLAKRALGDYQDAIADFDHAIELNPQFAQAYVSRGIAKRITKEYQDAIADLDKALELAPEHARAYRHRGLAKRALGDKVGAQADFAKAQELDPSLEPPESS